MDNVPHKYHLLLNKVPKVFGDVLPGGVIHRIQVSQAVSYVW